MRNTPVLFDAIFTSSEAAEAWGVTRQTVTRWIASGHAVPARQLPGDHGSYVFTGSEVERVAAKPRPKRGRPSTRRTASAAA